MSTAVTTSLNIWRKPVSRADLAHSHKEARVCAQEGCTTILSIYNPARFCAVHSKRAEVQRQGVAARDRDDGGEAAPGGDGDGRSRRRGAAHRQAIGDVARFPYLLGFFGGNSAT